jgi:hypothetical protein
MQQAAGNFAAYFEHDIDVCLTQPEYVKAIRSRITDKKNFKRIVDL